ncbi:hypothetical protein IC232_03525 [Microvirga sp. BT688]|uniref:hypothetical protein n=1 Tax=Microvirga sp. TaxID=1873136 RepID=UPI001682BF45|nr:hypothetical protein [Microvirga sp.]MBD2745760.1 hypothetical protein [Microvirga sp.]
MTFWGFLTMVALVIGLSGPTGVTSAYAANEPAQTPQTGTMEWLTQQFEKNKDWFTSQGKDLTDFASGWASCQMSGAADCSVEKVKDQIAADRLKEGMGLVGSKVTEVVKKLNNSCWSCDTYVAIFGALMGLAGETFSYFVESREIIGLAVVVLSIILVIKIFLIISAPAAQDFNSAYGDVFKYMGRVAVVFLVFLNPLTASALKSGDSEHPAKVLFVDGPLMLGTEVGRLLVEETSAITKAKIQNKTCAAPTTGSGSLSSFATDHLKTACNLLWSFHSMGVAGIASGTWLMFEAPVSMNNPSIGALISVILAGFVMTLAFLWFTITFGLRYLDALVRAGLTLALLPVFLFFWVFGSTRSIAHAGLRSILYMGAVFAASGFVFVICNEIMNYGFAKALGSSVSSNASEAFMNSMGGGGFNWFIGTGAGSNGGEANWLSFFYLMGAWGLATKAATIVFQLAGELVEFQGGLSGAGQEAEKDLDDKAQMGKSVAGKGLSMGGSAVMGAAGRLIR